MSNEKIVFQGLDAIRMATDDLEVVILPEWGSKIISIRDKRTNREWLHKNPHFEYVLPKYGTDYNGGHDIGGFDECFPNVAEGHYPVLPWQGIPLPDHGEVWSLPWDVKLSNDEVNLVVKGIRLPYMLQKTVKLIRNNGLRIDYQLDNLSDFDLPFIWSSHPLLEINPGMKLEIHGKKARLESGDLLNVQTGELFEWPVYQGIDLLEIQPKDNRKAAKIFVSELEEGIVSLSDTSIGSRFEMKFDPQLVTCVGLWLNYGGWAGKAGVPGYYNIGLEPCIGGADSLERAFEIGEYGLLKANSQLSWWLEIRVS